jgi:hypothetical protein
VAECTDAKAVVAAIQLPTLPPLAASPVAAGSSCCAPSPGFDVLSDKQRESNPTDLQVAFSGSPIAHALRPPTLVRVYDGGWVGGYPHGACVYETHGGATFRGFLAALADGWPAAAAGVLCIPKHGRAADGSVRVKKEEGAFRLGVLHGSGRRTWSSMSGAIRVSGGREG